MAMETLYTFGQEKIQSFLTLFTGCCHIFKWMLLITLHNALGTQKNADFADSKGKKSAFSA
jgi:hypothetical protein